MDEQILYCFGVVPREAAPALESAAISTVADERLAVIATRVPRREFGEEAIAERMQSVDWLTRHVLRHDEVLRRAMRTATVIPWRFGSIFETEDGVRRVLAERGEQFRGLLATLEGKEEWTVQGACLDEARLIAHVRDSVPCLRALVDEEHDAGPGVGYLMGRRRELRERAEMEACLHATAADAGRKLATVALMAPLPDLPGEAQPRVFHRQAALVARSSRSEFARFVEALDEQDSDRGVRWSLIGPHPPYSFVGEG